MKYPRTDETFGEWFGPYVIGQFTLNFKTLIIDPAGHTVVIAVISLPENGSQRHNNQQTYTVSRGIEFN